MFQEVKYALSDIVDWLEERPEDLGEYLKLIVMAAFAALFLSIVAAAALAMFSAPMVSYTQVTAEPIGEVGVNCLKIMSWQFWTIITLTEMVEELIFRVVPLVATALITALVVYLINAYTGKDINIRRAVIAVALVVALPCSLYFGYGHGNIFNLFVQGVTGYILSLVYIKCGGVSWNLLTGFLSSSAMHFLFNAILFMNALVAGMSYFCFNV